MKLSRISFGNLRRRKGKTFMLTAGLTTGVAMVVAMLNITFQMKGNIEKKLDEYGANIIVVPRAESLSLSYGGVNITDTYDMEELGEADATLIRDIKNRRNISAVAPKVIGTHRIEGHSFLVVGVDFPAEFRIKKWWRLQGTASRIPGIPVSLIESPGEIILGNTVAKTLNIKSGGTLRIREKDYVVKGVLEENASQDDMAVFMGIGEAQRLLGKKGRLSMIEVSALCSDCPIDDIVAQIRGKLPHAKVSAVRQAMTLKMQTVKQIIKFSFAVSVVVLAIGSLVVFVSMMSSVNERTKEIGVLRAIGFRKTHIIKVILTEAFVVSLVSGIAGWVVGSLSAAFLAPEGMNVLAFDPKMMALAAAVALVVGMSSSVYPALRASKLEPLEALRYI